MTRRCSHCSNNGHNSRTCPTKGGVKLFGVRLTDGSIKKSASMGNLSSAHYYSSSSAAASPNPISPSSDPLRDSNPVSQGYDSDDPVHVSSSSNARGDRKKGIPWTEEEHRLFLLGLQKLGKGDWRGIARNFVVSRTPTQVASHAQKYFIRQTNASRRKRRSSLFDMVPDMSMDSSQGPEEQFLLQSSQGGESENIDKLPSLSLSINPESELMGITSNEASIESEVNFAPMIPTFFPTYLPITFSLSPAICEKGEMSSQHKVLKPTPKLSKEYVNVDEFVGISKLNLCEAVSDCVEPSLLSLKLLGDPSRQSAFHANTSVGEADLRKSDSAIHAV